MIHSRVMSACGPVLLTQTPAHLPATGALASMGFHGHQHGTAVGRASPSGPVESLKPGEPRDHKGLGQNAPPPGTPRSPA